MTELSDTQIEDAISIAGVTTIAGMRSRLDAIAPLRKDQIVRVEAAEFAHERQQEAARKAAETLKREQGKLAHLTAGATKIEGRIAELKEQQRLDREAKSRTEREAERNRQRAIEDGLIALGKQDAP